MKQPPIRIVLCALFSPLTVASATAQCVDFFPGFSLSTGSEPSDVILVDVDANGSKDILTADRGSDGLTLLLNAGSSFFGAPATVLLTPGDRPQGLATGDLVALEGRDIAVACAGSNVVRVLANDPVGTLSVSFSLPVPGERPVAVAVAQLDGSGREDIVVAMEGQLLTLGGGLAVSLNGGFMTLLPAPPGGFLAVRSVAVCDLDGDGDQDIVAVMGNTAFTPSVINNVLLYENNGSGAFALAGTLSAAQNPASVCCADLDGNGYRDVVVTVGDFPLAGPAGVLAFLHDAAPGMAPGDFAPTARFSAAGAQYPTDLACADFGQDGLPGYLSDLDVVTINFGSGNLSCFNSFSGGSFGSTCSAFVGLNPVAVAVADLNADGTPDIVAANVSSNNVTILRGVPRALAQVYGVGCPGTSALVPSIAPVGLPTASSVFGIQLTQARAWSPAWVLVSLELDTVSLGGGCGLYLGNPWVLVTAVTDGIGQNTLNLAMPPPVPPYLGLNAYFQYAILDPVGPLFGLAFSNALRIKIGVP